MAGNPFEKYRPSAAPMADNPFAKYSQGAEAPALDDTSYAKRMGKRIYAGWQEQSGGLVTGVARGLRTPQTFADRVKKEAEEIRMRDNSLGEFARATAETLKAPFDIVMGATVEEAVQGAVDLLPGETRDRFLDEAEAVGEGLYDRGQQQRAAAGEFNIRRPDGFEPGQAVKFYGTQALESLGANMAPAMAVGIVTRGRTNSLNNILDRHGIKRVDEDAMTQIGGLGTMGAQVWGAEYERAFRATGGDHEAASEQATVRMFAEVVPEIIPFGFAMKVASPLAKAVKELGGFKAAAGQIVGGVLTEGASEVLTEIINTTYDAYGLGKQINASEFRTQMIDAFMVGALMGAGMNIPSAAGEVINGRRKPATPASGVPADPAGGDPITAELNKHIEIMKQDGSGQDLGAKLDATPEQGGIDLSKMRRVHEQPLEVDLGPTDLNQPQQTVGINTGPAPLPGPIAPPSAGIQPTTGPAAAVEPPALAPDATAVPNPFAKYTAEQAGTEGIAPPLPAAIEQAHPDPTPPPGDRWTADRGAMPGEPAYLLDMDGDTGDALAAIIEREDDQGGVLYEAVDGEGQSLGVGQTIEEAAGLAESRFPAADATPEPEAPAAQNDSAPLSDDDLEAMFDQAAAEVEAEKARVAPPPVDWRTDMRERFFANERMSIGVADLEALLKDRPPQEGLRNQESAREIGALRDSIKERGIVRPISLSADKDGRLHIADGTHRLLVARELGLERVPVTLTPNFADYANETTAPGLAYEGGKQEIADTDGLPESGFPSVDVSSVDQSVTESETVDNKEETVDELVERFREIPPAGIHVIRGKGKGGVAAADEALAKAGYVEIPYGKSTLFVHPDTKKTAFSRSQGTLAGVIVQFGKANKKQVEEAAATREANRLAAEIDSTTIEKEQGNDDVSRQEAGTGRERGQESGQPEVEPGEQPRPGAGSEARGSEVERPEPGRVQRQVTAEGEGEVTPPSAPPAAEATTGLRYDPSTNRYNGQKLARGDVVRDADGKEYSVDRVDGFMLTLDELDAEGWRTSNGAWVSVDPTDSDRFKELTPTGRNVYEPAAKPEPTPEPTPESTPEPTPEPETTAEPEAQTPEPAANPEAEKPDQKRKLENTGTDLRRFWEQLKADAEAAKSDGERTWNLVSAKTQRAKVFNPKPGEGATPGVQRYYDALQSALYTFSEIVQSGWGLEDPRSKYYGAPMGEQVARRIDRPQDYWGSSRDGSPPDFRAMLMDWGREYTSMMHSFAEAMSGAKTIEEAEAKLAAIIDTVSFPANNWNKFKYLEGAPQMTVGDWRNGKDATRSWGPVESTARIRQLLMIRADKKEARPTWTLAEMITDQNKSSDTSTKKKLIRPRVETVHRDGKEVRKGDVTPKQFKDEFGFADVGFGSWVAKGKDQDHLNHAWDAFADLAERLGVPRKAMGFFGKMHFTIGALGRGKAAAHFSPNQPSPAGPSVAVINLTNTKGDGTVAHEWGHALDYLAMRGTRDQLAVMEFIVEEMTRVRSATGLRKRLERSLRNGTYMQRSGKAGSIENLTALARYYAGKRGSSTTQYYKNAFELGKDYWAKPEELFARAWESFIYDTLENGNNYLVNDWVGDGVTKKPGYRGTPYPEGEERARFAVLFEALVKALRTDGDDLTVSRKAFLEALPQEVRDYESEVEKVIEAIPEIIAEYEAEQEALRQEKEKAKQEKIAADQAAEAEKWRKAAEAAEAEQRLRDAERQAAEAEKADQAAAGDIASGVGADKALTDDELNALFDQALNEIQEERQEQPDVPQLRTEQNAQEVPEDGTPAPRGPVPTASKLIKEAAAQGVTGIDEALTALAKLFPPNKLHSFPPTIDQDSYNKAKPHFEASLKAFQASGKTLLELFKFLIEQLGAGIKPYLLYWAKEEKLSNNLSSSKPPSASAPVENTLEAFLRGRVREITDNNKLKAALEEYHGHAPTEAEIKAGQEALELALVREAQAILAQGMGRDATFDALLQLYENQPNLNSRSSTSMENQAYSTPLPLAYLASKLADIRSSSTVYEPTAGNGALLIAANSTHSIVNELNPERAHNLRSLGYSVTENDASAWRPGTTVDAAIMNPPFGGLDKPVKIDGYTVSKIDHLIAAKALETLKDNGRATLIIGANMKEGDLDPATRTFLNWLYSHYNVVDHFEVAGGLYKKQGAGWPVAVITINGRVASERVFDATVTRHADWSAINEHVKAVLDSEGFAGLPANRTVDTGQAAQDGDGASQPTGGAADAAGAGSGRTGRSGRGGAGGVPGRAGSGAIPGGQSQPGDRGGNPDAVGPAVAQPDTGKQPGRGKQESGAAGGVSDAGVPGAAVHPQSGVEGSDYQVPYQPASGGLNESVLLPVNMRTALETAMRNLRDAVGDIDAYVMQKLGYKRLEDMQSNLNDTSGLMALQVDAVAAMIHNLESKNRGVIVADQTGVGKGRQAAAMIRYALKHDMVPVFVTAQANLFTDMYDDLLDIGETGARPFLFNADGGFIVDREGGPNKFQNKPESRKAAFKQLQAGKLPDGRNMLMLTYSQTNNTGSQQRMALEALKASGKKLLFILDEAHNIAGTREKWDSKAKEMKPSRAGFWFNLIDEQPVVYMSATYAKRPDNMPIFYRTDLIDAVESVDQLEDAIAAGGEALQTVVANMLTQSGQLWRRERSFAGIDFKTVTFGKDKDGNPIPGSDKERERHGQIADQATKGLREIVRVDSMFTTFMEENPKDAQDIVTDLVGSGGDWASAGTKADLLLQHSPFASIVHNFVSQLLLSLKADWIVSEAIALHKAGKKPVIALNNTMQSFLEAEIERGHTGTGKEWTGDYRSILHAALARTRHITLTDKKGDKTRVEVPLDKLPPLLQEEYLKVTALIEKLPLQDVVLFYIDYIRQKLEAADIKTGEITGRSLMVDYSTKPPTVRQRPDASKKHRRGTVDKFNKGGIDALILNAAGSTGLSIHASERFKDQRPRHMLVAQAIPDINILMQMFGRINRTGQVRLPEYSMLGLDLPSEARPLAMTARKMRSLNANTSANTESETSLDVAAVLNKYGDQVVLELLLEEEKYQKLSALEVDEKTEKDGLALRFTGRMALAPIKDQHAAWDEIRVRYSALIEELDATNRNDLKTDIIDLDARIIENKVVYEGKDPTSIFGGNTVLHKITAKVQGRAPTGAEVLKAVTEALGGKTAKEVSDALLEQMRSGDTLLADLEKEIDALKKWAQNEGQSAPQAEKDKANERYKELNSKAGARRAHVASVERGLRDYAIGSAWKLDLGDDVVTGVVTGVQNVHKEGHGDPFSASKVRIKFIVNGPGRHVTLPLSKIQKGEVIERGLYIRDPSQIANLFDSVAGTSSRETRYIATGNLLGGYTSLKDDGRVVAFTAANGKTYHGILMPKKYGKDGEYDSKDSEPVLVRKWQEAAAYLRGVKRDGNLSPLGMFNLPGQDVRVKLDVWGNASITVARKRGPSDKVKFDKKLQELMGGEFVGRSQFLTVDFHESRLDAVLERLVELTTLYIPGSGAESLTKITGRTPMAAAISFDGSATDDESLRETFRSEGDLLDTAEPEDAPRFNRAETLPIGFGVGRVTPTDDGGKVTFFSQQLEAALTKFTGKPVERGTFKQVAPPERHLKAVRAIEKAFGRRVVFFRTNGGFPISFNGVALPRDPKTIYVNIDSTNPFMGVVGHELLHTLRQTDPALYERLERVARKRLKKGGQDVFAFEENARISEAAGDKPLSEDKMFEEMVANVVGDAFLDPAFLKELAAEDATLFERLMNAILDILQSFQKQMRNRGMGTTQYFRDVENLIADTQSILRTYRPSGPVQGRPTLEAREEAPQFARTTPPGLTPEQRDFLKRAGMDPDARTLAARIRDYLGVSWETAKTALSDSIQMGLFDKFYGIKRAYREYLAEPVEAHESGYIAARLSTGAASVMRGILLYGAPKYRNGIIQRIDGSKGLLDVFKPVQDELEQFLGWMIARRADRLYGEGKENNFTRDHIDAGLQFAAGTITINGQTRTRAEVYDEVAEEFAVFKGTILDLAQEAGLIDATTRPVWDKADWIPFYRVANARQEGGVKFGGGMGLSHQSSGIRKLVGGTERLNDPLGNIIMNFSHLVQASMKNMALQKTVDDLAETPAIKKVGLTMRPALVPKEEVKRMMIADGIDESTIEMLEDETGGEIFEGIARLWALAEPSGKEVVKVLRNGKPEYYQINDPMLLKSLTNVDIEALGGLFKPLRGAKTLLTTMVTAEPSFMARNFTRDALHAWVINEDHFIPGYDSVRGLVKSAMEKGGMLDMMFAGGSFQGGYINGTDPEAARKSIRAAMRAKGYSNEYIQKHVDTIIDTTAGIWDKWRRVGDAIENANREAVYEAAIRSGKGKAQAIYEAKDLMDFSMHGSWRWIQMFNDMLPFFNARLQGLYKLGRSGAVPIPGLIAKEIAMRGLWIALASVALAWLNDDDEDYQALEDWDKDTYWHVFPGTVFHTRIPKPFEVGIIYGTIPERMYRALRGQDTVEKFFDRMGHAFLDTMAFDPIPQAAKPGFEVWANQSRFTGRPIENMGDERKLPRARYDATTSDTMVALGPMLEKMGLSPKQGEHLLRGYLGTLGNYALMTADIITRDIMGRAPIPAKSVRDLPVIGSFLRGSGPAWNTRYGTELYEMHREVTELWGTVKAFQEDGEADKVRDLLNDNDTRRTLASRKALAAWAKNRGAMRKAIERIYANETMTPEEKRERIDRILERRNRADQQAYKYFSPMFGRR